MDTYDSLRLQIEVSVLSDLLRIHSAPRNLDQETRTL